MKFTAAFVTAAHAAAKKIADVTLTYRQKLSQAMKAAYAAAKTVVFEGELVPFGKGLTRATEGQFRQIIDLLFATKQVRAIRWDYDNFKFVFTTTRAEQIIAALRAGKQVRVSF
jgi:hypothetical protein